MKIGLDPGHNCKPDTGCSGLFPRFPTEDTLTKELADKCKERLEKQGFEVVVCLPEKPVRSVSESLQARVNKANKEKVDLFVSLHFNCFNKSANGTECFAISNTGRRVAKLICDEICKACGFVNRGVKNGDRLFVVRNTLAPAVLVEVCFCDSELDMRRYDADKAAGAILSGISEFAKARKANQPQ